MRPGDPGPLFLSGVSALVFLKTQVDNMTEIIDNITRFKYKFLMVFKIAGAL
jgi:hypothetical protein